MAVREVENPYRFSRLEITLHNVGGRLVVIDGARIKIRRVYEVPLCATQGDLVVSHAYGVVLPIDSRSGRTIKASLHQQIGPDEADRFGIDLSTRMSADAPAAVHLFEADVSLLDDGSQSPLPLGTIIVALPKSPAGGQYFWDDKVVEILRNYVSGEGRSVRDLWGGAMPCWRSNTAILRWLRTRDAVRSAPLEAAFRELVTPAFSKLE